MEGLELFAGSSPAERALAAKLQMVEEELAGYKEEHRYAEARVSAYTHILRQLEGDPIPGMCGGCYLKLKKRVRTLESEHLSPAALAGLGPRNDEAGRHSQGEGLESAAPVGVETELDSGLDTALETGLEKGQKGVNISGEHVVKPVRAARRLPRQIEVERVNEGLAALTRIQVAPLRREHSTTDSVAAVIDNQRLAAIGHSSGTPLVNEEEVVSAPPGVQEESQGEVEGGSGPSVITGDSVSPSAAKTKSGAVYGSARVEGLSGGLPEDSGDCSVNGGLQEGEMDTPGQSPLRKGDAKKAVVQDDVSSDEGSTARAEGKGLETGLAGRVLSRVMNLSNKSIGSSSSSIVGPEAQELGMGVESERGGSSEGAAESEWKDAQTGDEDDLLDDGDSRAPVSSPSVKQTDVAGEDSRVKVGGEDEALVGEKSDSVAEKWPALEGEAGLGGSEEGSVGDSSGKVIGPLADQSHGEEGNKAVGADQEGLSDEGGSNGAVGEVEESAVEPNTERDVEPSSEEGALGEGDSGQENGVGNGDHGSAAAKLHDDISEPQIADVESGGDNDDINVDEVVADDSSSGGVGAVSEQDAAVSDNMQTGPGNADGIRGVRKVLRVRPRVSVNFPLFAALKSATQTTQEGQVFHEEREERLERLRRQKAEKEAAELQARQLAAAEARTRQLAAAEERARQLGAAEERARQLAVSAKPTMAERLRGRGADAPSVTIAAEKPCQGTEPSPISTLAEQPRFEGKATEPPVIRINGEEATTAEQPSAETGAGDAGGKSPWALPGSFLQAVAGGSGESAPAAAATGPVRKVLTAEEKKARMVSKKDFVHMERDRSTGRMVNILQGLELHKNVLSEKEQAKLVARIEALQEEGRAGKLMPRTFTQPRKWMRGKGRVTIQFGCCYNYAVDKMGNPPGILRTEAVDPIPAVIQSVIKRLVDWGVMPKECTPDSCIVNIYDEGDCIPPHIDHHDFLRPFCTLSLLTKADIVFGTSLQAVAEGEFRGPVRIALPVGSVLILNGNGADVAKHCIPGVPARRISITLRKMDPAKAPHHLTQTALHTPLPGPPLPPPPNNDRGSSSDSWRRAPPDDKPTETRFGNPGSGDKATENRFGNAAPWGKVTETRSASPGSGDKLGVAEEAWPELGGSKKKADVANVDVAEAGLDKPDVSAGAALILKGAWGKRQEAKTEGMAAGGATKTASEKDDVAQSDVAQPDVPKDQMETSDVATSDVAKVDVVGGDVEKDDFVVGDAPPVLRGSSGERQEVKLEVETADWPPEPEGGLKTGASDQAEQEPSDRADVEPIDDPRVGENELADASERAADSEVVERPETEIVEHPVSEPSKTPETESELAEQKVIDEKEVDGERVEEKEEPVSAETAGETAADVQPKPAEPTGASAKVLISTLRAAAPPFEAPPKRTTPPAPSHNNQFDNLSRSRGGPRPSSASLTSSPVKKWASSTETPVAAASDLAMAVQKMVGREKLVEDGPEFRAEPRAELRSEPRAERRAEIRAGSRADSRPEPRVDFPGEPRAGYRTENRAESRPEVRGEAVPRQETVRRPRSMPSEVAQRLGLQLSAGGVNFAPPRSEERIRSVGPDSRAVVRQAKAESLVDEGASWADIEMENETSPTRRGGSAPRRGVWQPPPRGTSSERYSRPLERPLDMQALFERQARAAEFERALGNRYLEQPRGSAEVGNARYSGQMLDPLSAELIARAERMSRIRDSGLERWGHDDRGSERFAGREHLLRAQDDLMYGNRVGIDRRQGGLVTEENWFGRREGQRDPRGERLVTHPKAEALREAGGW